MINSQVITHQFPQKERQLYNDKLVHTSNPNKFQSTSQEDTHEIIENNQTHGEQELSHIDVEQSTLNTIKSTQDVEFFEQSKAESKRNKYGNMIIFCQSKKFLLSLGPNYLFFFFAYLCFTLATIYLVGLVNHSIQSTSFKIFNFIFCWMQNLSYLLVALSNPGIQLSEDRSLMSQQEQKSKRFCHKCEALQQRKTYHCRQCDVCVRDYDHHCPWTSKCIGGGNLNRFYFFVCMTPFYIFYYMVVFMICMANSAVGHNNNLKVHTKTF